MRTTIFMAACLLHAACAAPQFVTFKDGKVGVNFGGYHAEAGLGGLLTGNAAHGGLSASAGTPWGPKAAAGLGGAVDGRTSGLAYAGAEANPSVGASAVLGGSTGEHGFIGSEAHTNGRASGINLSGQPRISLRSEPVTSAPLVPPLVFDEPTDAIQKIRPPKKYQLIKNEDSHHSSSTSTADLNADSSISGSNDNPTLMINVHRQRMRERRRQQHEQEEALEQSERKRAIDQRARNRQRLYPRQRLVTRSKTIDINVNGSGNDKKNATENAAPAIQTRVADSKQNSINADVNAVHSKHFVKSIHKSLGPDGSGYAPPPATPGQPVNVNYNANTGVLGNALNIPIGILRVIQESLTGMNQG